MKSTVDQLSWIERLYPSNVTKGMANSLDSFSDWLKKSKAEASSVIDSAAKDTNNSSYSSSKERYCYTFPSLISGECANCQI